MSLRQYVIAIRGRKRRDLIHPRIQIMQHTLQFSYFSCLQGKNLPLIVHGYCYCSWRSIMSMRPNMKYFYVVFVELSNDSPCSRNLLMNIAIQSAHYDYDDQCYQESVDFQNYFPSFFSQQVIVFIIMLYKSHKTTSIPKKATKETTSRQGAKSSFVIMPLITVMSNYK